MDQDLKNMNNNSNSACLKETSKDIGFDGISAVQQEAESFFSYFRHQIDNSSHRPPLDTSFNGIRLEADDSRLQNIADDFFSDGIPSKVKETKDLSSCKVDEDICLIDFTDTEDLNPDVSRMSNGSKESIAASEDLKSEHDESSKDLLESKNIQVTIPAVTAMTDDLQPDVTASENTSLQEVNHGIINPTNEINLLEPIEEPATMLAAKDYTAQCYVGTPEAHCQIQDILILQQEMNTEDNKYELSWNASHTIESNELLKQDVLLCKDTPFQEGKDLMKLYSISVKEEGSKWDEKKTHPGELGENDLLVFRSSSNENYIEGEGQNTELLKQAALEVLDKETEIINDKFLNDRDPENECGELNFTIDNINNVTNGTTGKYEKFGFHMDEIDFSEKSPLFKQFNLEDIENEWQKPDWKQMERSENNLSQDMESWALSFLDFENGTSEKLNGLIQLQKMLSENNSSAEVKSPEAEKFLETQGLQKTFANVYERNAPGNLARKDFKEAMINTFSIVQVNTEQRLEQVENQMDTSATELLSEFESLSNRKQNTLGVDVSFRQKSDEIIAVKEEEIDNSKREVMQQGNSESEMAPELDGLSNDNRRGDQKAKEGLAYNKYCIRPVGYKNLDAGNKSTNPFRDAQVLKMGMEQRVRNEYNGRNVAGMQRDTLKQRDDNTNNLNPPGKEQLRVAVPGVVRQSLRYPLRRMTIKATCKSDGRQQSKQQTKSVQDHGKQLPDGKKIPEHNIKQENTSRKKVNLKNVLTGNKTSQKSFYSRKKISQVLYNISSRKPSVTVVSDIQEQIQGEPSRINPLSKSEDDNNVPNPKTLIIGSCSNCVELRPLENVRNNLAGRNILLEEPALNIDQRMRRVRSTLKSVERVKRNSSLHKKPRKRPNKKVSFIDNRKIFSYDPSKSVVENFFEGGTRKIIKEEESTVGGEHCVGVRNSDKPGETSKEIPRDTDGYANQGFVDVPLFNCLPDFEGNAAVANVANFGEDETLLSSSPTARVDREHQKLSQRLSVASRRAEGNVRRWLMYGLMAHKGISFKKIMSKK